jgi:hypothetical protein
MLDGFDLERLPLDRELRAFAARQPWCRALSERLYGVGPVAATAVLAELGDCRRFTSSDDAVRHAGLDVTVYQSDSKRAAGHLSHEGSPVLRWALYEAGQQATRQTSPDREYFLQVRERTDHKSASLSVARKLCRRAYHILRRAAPLVIVLLPSRSRCRIRGRKGASVDAPRARHRRHRQPEPRFETSHGGSRFEFERDEPIKSGDVINPGTMIYKVLRVVPDESDRFDAVIEAEWVTGRPQNLGEDPA